MLYVRPHNSLNSMTKQISTTDYALMRGWNYDRVQKTLNRGKFLVKVNRVHKVGRIYTLEVDENLSEKDFKHYKK